MRATLRVPFVNLIWRHLATMPGMLAWTGAVVKPLHRTAALREAAAALRGAVGQLNGTLQPGCVFDAAGVGADDRRVIATMLRQYNAANAVNFLSLLVVQAILVVATPGHARPPGGDLPAPEVPPALPRLLGLQELPPSLGRLILALDRFGRLEDGDAVASLYRHLAHWPGFLAIVHAALSVPHATGALRADHERPRSQARRLMEERLLPFGEPPCTESRAGQGGGGDRDIHAADDRPHGQHGRDHAGAAARRLGAGYTSAFTCSSVSPLISSP